MISTKSNFFKMFLYYKYILYNYHYKSVYASHLWSKYLCSLLNYLQSAYNDSFWLIYWLKHNVNARELQVKTNILILVHYGENLSTDI